MGFMNLGVISLGFMITADPAISAGIKSISVIKNGKKQGLIRIEINEDIIPKLRIEMIEAGFNQDVFPQKNYNYMDIQIISFDLFLRGIVTPKGLKIYEKTLNTLKP